MKSIITFILSVLINLGFTQVNTFYVNPIETNLGYEAIQDSHLVVRNNTTNNNKLFLFIGGTGSSTRSYQTISRFAGNQGYDVINIAYPNSVAAASLSNSIDSTAFTKYRQEICYGTALSSSVNVDSLNSIYSRTVNLLNYLNATYPSQNWDQYLTTPTTLNWSKIIVSGHSQGSGHACYFGKVNEVDRVVMFSGPNDYSDHYSNSATWLRTPGLTHLDRHFSYLSLLDEIVDYDKQLTNLEGLGLYPKYDTTYVDNIDPPYNNSRCLYTSQAPGLAILNHSSPMKLSVINNSVWTYMLTSDVTTSIHPNTHKKDISIYPNPISSIASIYLNPSLYGQPFTVFNSTGKTVLTGKFPNTTDFGIDFSPLENGTYFFSIDGQTSKVIKH